MFNFNQILSSATDFYRSPQYEIFPWDKDGRCVGLTSLPPRCVDCLEIVEPQGPVQASSRKALPFTFSMKFYLHPSSRSRADTCGRT